MNYRQMLKIRRKEHKVRQTDFLCLGIGQAQYSKLERGSDAMLSTLERAALLLGLEIRLVPRERIAEVDLLLATAEPLAKIMRAKRNEVLIQDIKGKKKRKRQVS